MTAACPDEQADAPVASCPDSVSAADDSPDSDVAVAAGFLQDSGAQAVSAARQDSAVQAADDYFRHQDFLRPVACHPRVVHPAYHPAPAVSAVERFGPVPEPAHTKEKTSRKRKSPTGAVEASFILRVRQIQYREPKPFHARRQSKQICHADPQYSPSNPTCY
jgi:hypothetical protein